MNAIVISLNGRTVHSFGCYGSSDVETPAIDQLATDGFAFDQCLLESPSAEITRRNWWSGCYAIETRQFDAPHRSAELIARLQSHGIHTAILHDLADGIQPEPESAGFVERHAIESDSENPFPIFQTAVEWLAKRAPDDRFLLFIECHSLLPSIPATNDLTATDDEHHAEADAYDPSDFEELDDDYDADESPAANDESDDAGLAYSSDLLPPDQQLGHLLDWLRGNPLWEKTLLIVTSNDGNSLEYDANRPSLVVELGESRIHVPLVLRCPGTDPAGRSSALVQPIDLMPTVFDAMGIPLPEHIDGRSLLPVVRAEQLVVREWARTAIHQRWIGVRTPIWYLVRPWPGQSACDREPARLFVKPDDRWEVNDVAKQHPETIEELAKLDDSAANAEA